MAEAVLRTADSSRAEVDGMAPAAWDEIVNLFEDGSYDQTAAYAGHLRGEERLSRLVLRRDGRIVAAAQTAVFALPGLGRGLAYVKFGPLWRRKGEAPDLAHLSAILTALQDEYAVRRGHMLTILPPPDPMHGAAWPKLLSQAGFCQRRPFDDANRYLVDLRLDADAQRASLSQKWRAHLKKATRAALDFSSGRDEAHFDAFRRLHDRMTTRKGFTESDALLAVPAMIARLPEPMRPQIVLGWHDGEPTVGAVVGRVGEVSQYLFGASDDRALPLKAGYALQWHVLVQQRQTGAVWYDLGGEVGSDGLRQFKKGLVGRVGTVAVLPGEWDYWSAPAGRYAGDALFAARRAVTSLRQLYGQLRPG